MLHPRARRQGLRIEASSEGLTIHDPKRGATHALDPVTAFVWRHADGETTAPEIAAALRRELRADVDDETVWLALDDLAEADLLYDRVTPPGGVRRLARREMMVSLLPAAGAAAVALGVISRPMRVLAQTEQQQKQQQEQMQKAELQAKQQAEQSQKAEAHAKESDAKCVTTAQSGETLSLLSGFQSSAGFAVPSLLQNSNVVHLSGVVIRTDSTKATIAVLPSCARPAAELIFTVWSGSNQPTAAVTTGPTSVAGQHPTRVDVLPDGSLVLPKKSKRPIWVSLDGIAFVV